MCLKIKLLFSICCGLMWLASAPVACAEEPAPVPEIAYEAGLHSQLPALANQPNDWPWWRGPTLNNVAAEQIVPLEFGPERNIAWSLELPGRGHASPIVVGKLVVVLTAEEASQTYRLLACDRGNGEIRWNTKLHEGGFAAKIHRMNSHASATPACDGERIFTAVVKDKQLWVSAVNLAGKVLWQQPAGPYDSIYGFGSAPALYESLVIICGENDQLGSWMAALHRGTGKIVWRVRRPNIDTYATPLVATIANKPQLILGGAGFVTSYNPATGTEIWRCAGPTAETTANTAAFSSEHVYVSGGYPKPYALQKIRATGVGEVTATHLDWKLQKGMPYVPSPLFHEGLLYIADDIGLGTCLDVEKGTALWARRLGGDISASPVMCGERIYVCHENGDVRVLARGRK